MTKKNKNNEIVGLKIIDFGMTSPLFKEYLEVNMDVSKFINLILPIEFKKSSKYKINLHPTEIFP